MTANKLNILNKFKVLKIVEKFFLYACITTAVGFLLPWNYMKGYGWLGVGSIATTNGLEGLGTILFLLALVSGGLIFYKKKYATISSLVVVGLLLLILINRLREWQFVKVMGGGTYGWESAGYFGFGFLLTYLGAIAMLYFTIKFVKEGVLK